MLATRLRKTSWRHREGVGDAEGRRLVATTSTRFLGQAEGSLTTRFSLSAVMYLRKQRQELGMPRFCLGSSGHTVPV